MNTARTPSDRPEVAVVHLIWAPLGPEPVERFLASYTSHPAGREHRLAVIFNGFTGPHDPRLAEARAALQGLEHQSVLTARPLLDLAAYRQAALELDARWLCFMNSFSEILCDGWLELLCSPTRDPRIGAVAATGSWGSHLSHMRYDLHLGGPYAPLFPDREAAQRVFAQLAREGQDGSPGGPSAPAPSAGRLASAARLGASLPRLAPTLLRRAIGFSAFPAPHLRTNGLLIERALWLDVCPPALRDKLATHRLESGRASITATLRDAGREVALVGRDGRAYPIEQWPASNVFWQRDQQNLLIADNQTRAYQDGDALRRSVLCRYAWGAQGAALEPVAAGEQSG